MQQLAGSERANVLHHVQQVLDYILAMNEVDALQALICQMACIAGLPKGHKQRWRPKHLLQSRCHL